MDGTDIAAFVRTVGGRLAHVTARMNVPAIMECGLLPAQTLALRAHLDPATLPLPLRTTRVQAGRATLNHQFPIVRGLPSARRVLDGHSPETWAAQLDTRIFFWPHHRVAKFAASFARKIETSVLWIDPVRLADAMGDHIDLSPLNSGSFMQGASKAMRGDWLYVPLSRGRAAFRTHRIARGLKRTRDSVSQVFLRAPMPSDGLKKVLIDD